MQAKAKLFDDAGNIAPPSLDFLQRNPVRQHHAYPLRHDAHSDSGMSLGRRTVKYTVQLSDSHEVPLRRNLMLTL